MFRKYQSNIRHFKWIIICQLLIWSGQNIADAQTIDSLRSEISKMRIDSTRIQQYVALGDLFFYQDEKDSATFYFSKAIHALKLDPYPSLRRLHIYAARSRAVVQLYAGRYNEALPDFELALTIAKKYNDSLKVGACHGDIGDTYYRMGLFAPALNHLLKSLKIITELGDSAEMSRAMTNIGTLYSDQSETEKALNYYTQSLKIDYALGDKFGVAGNLHNIGDLLYQQGKYDSALRHFLDAYSINLKSGNKEWLVMNLGSIGLIYLDTEQTDSARAYFERGLKLSQELDDRYSLTLLRMYLGKVSLLEKDYNSALNYLNQAQQTAEESHSIALLKDTEKALSEYYDKTGNHKKSLEHYKTFIRYRDSIYNEENNRKLIRMELNYDYEKKEADLVAEQAKKDAIAQAEMGRQRAINRGLILGAIFILIFAVVAFLQRNAIKKSKKRSDDLLLNILPEEVAEELKATGQSDAQLINSATVIFTDFKGFTEIAANLAPAALVQEIHKCFSAFDTIVQKYDIEKIKTIGDAYMAAGGIPSPSQTHAVDVVLAGLEIQSFMEGYAREQKERGEPFFEIRIGIHTGPLVAGIVGIKKFQYDIWGDTVNLAARMESSGEAGKVNVSQATYEFIKNDPRFMFEHRGKVEAKGKGEVDMWFVKFR